MKVRFIRTSTRCRRFHSRSVVRAYLYAIWINTHTSRNYFMFSLSITIKNLSITKNLVILPHNPLNLFWRERGAVRGRFNQIFGFSDTIFRADIGTKNGLRQLLDYCISGKVEEKDRKWTLRARCRKELTGYFSK